MRPIDRFLDRVRSKGLRVDEDGDEWWCQCPAHNDGRPSLKVGESSDGKVLLKCFAGCSAESIVRALGLEMKDLFPPSEKREAGSGKRPSPPAPSPSGKERGDREPPSPSPSRGEKKKSKREGSKLVATYTYKGLDGRAAHLTYRFFPKNFAQARVLANGDRVGSFKEGWYAPGLQPKKWEAVKSDPPLTKNDPAPFPKARWFDEFKETLLYRLQWVVDAAQKGQTVWLCEGEKDADRVGSLKDDEGKKLVATCQPMGAGKWEPQYTEWLKGAKVKQILDRDLAGFDHGLLVAKHLEEAGIEHEIYLPAVVKDASDHLDAGLELEDLVPVSLGEVAELREQARLEADEALRQKQSEPGNAAADEEDGGGGSEGPPKRRRNSEEDWDGETAWEKNDLANAKRFIAEHGKDLRHCARFGQWLSWNGSYWTIDETKGSPIVPRWEATLAKMKARLLEIDDKTVRNAWGGWVKTSMGHPAFCRALNFAQIMPGVAVTPEELDQEDDLIPVANGVLDLRRMELVEAAREQMFTRGVNVPYDPTADCPTWIEHLDRCTGGDPELLSVLHKVFGYLLTGRTDEQKLYFLYGEGKTGKSTTVWVLEQILGEFAKSIRKRYLMAGLPQGDEATVFASLKGARMVVAVEVQPNDRFEEGVVKMATGEDKIVGRLMRENPFEYKARFKLILTGNYRPRIEGQDHGIWRRFAMVPFDQQIQTIDVDHKKKLMAELPGILNWMAYGAKRWYEEGGVGTCAAIDGATKEYREEQDVLGQFFRDCCAFEEGAKVESTPLFNIYKQWAKDGMILPWSITRFGREMAMREKHFNYQRVRRNGAVTFLGVRGKEAWDD